MKCSLDFGSQIKMTEEHPTKAERELANSDVQKYLYLPQERRRLFSLAALVQVCAGIIAVLFRDALAAADTVRNLLITRAHQ
jgi:hypothetical protein